MAASPPQGEKDIGEKYKKRKYKKGEERSP